MTGDPDSGAVARLDATEIRQLVMDLRRLLTDEYVFPEVARTICEVLDDRLSNGAYDDIGDAITFANALTTDLQSGRTA